MRYEELASAESLQKTIDGLKNHGYEVEVVPNGKEALEKIKELVPEGASVMNGASVTLEDEHLKKLYGQGTHLNNSCYAPNIIRAE